MVAIMTYSTHDGHDVTVTRVEDTERIMVSVGSSGNFFVTMEEWRRMNDAVLEFIAEEESTHLDALAEEGVADEELDSGQQDEQLRDYSSRVPVIACGLHCTYNSICGLPASSTVEHDGHHYFRCRAHAGRFTPTIAGPIDYYIPVN
jgi:hypothetical protein